MGNPLQRSKYSSAELLQVGRYSGMKYHFQDVREPEAIAPSEPGPRKLVMVCGAISCCRLLYSCKKRSLVAMQFVNVQNTILVLPKYYWAFEQATT